MRNEEVDSRELDTRKTLVSTSVVKTADENEEFEKQRLAAIAEVAKNKEVCVCVWFYPCCRSYSNWITRVC